MKEMSQALCQGEGHISKGKKHAALCPFFFAVYVFSASCL